MPLSSLTENKNLFHEGPEHHGFCFTLASGSQQPWKPHALETLWDGNLSPQGYSLRRWTGVASAIDILAFNYYAHKEAVIYRRLSSLQNEVSWFRASI